MPLDRRLDRHRPAPGRASPDRTVKLTTGRTVTANDAYLLLAIENPDKQIVAGYQPGIMSGSIPKGSISAADAAKLVAYIKSLR